MKLMVVLGTRPEVIKLAPVVAEARRRSDQIELVVCSTGQHREMLDQTFGVFGIHADVDLAVMHADQPLAALTARLVEGVDNTLCRYKPDVVLVQGDTTTAFSAALAAFYRSIPVGHVEAGLRTGDLASPFPEELNRVLIARMVRWHFAPTSAAVNQLQSEGIHGHQIHLTGNTVVDAITGIRHRWAKDGESVAVKKAKSFFPERELVLITAHRRENQGSVMRQICAALRELCKQHPQLGFVFPVHLSPQVRAVVHDEFPSAIANLLLTDPVDFETSLYLQSRACLVITDSGGIQEEAPSFAVPTVVMREHTERMEGITSGFATLAGTQTDAIVRAANIWLADRDAKISLSDRPNPYGDGRAAQRIISIVLGESSGAFAQ